MTSQELRKKYLHFFKEKGHRVIPSASLIPEATDPTVLFTTAGMHPLVPYLMGEEHPEGKRLADVQKCVRTRDINDVGDPWHLTFFEMLGNWSLGDYFKKEAIEMAWEFLTRKKWLGIDQEKLSVSVFAGDKDAPRDLEAAQIWEKVGVPPERIYFYPKKENWWGPAGKTGPCGPDTEIFFDTGQKKCSKGCEPKCHCGKYAEIWNLVFMEYNKKAKSEKRKVKSYEYVPLKQKNVDTGMGVERTLAILNSQDNVYDTDLFEPLVSKTMGFLDGCGIKLDLKELKAVRIIVDHTRAATFILADNVVPSNLDQGYVLRRLIRRAVRYAKLLDIPQERNVTQELAQLVIEIMGSLYPELRRNKKKILEELNQEERKFERTLNLGLKQFQKMGKNKVISGKEAFLLFSSFGFPLEMTRELAREKGFKVQEKAFRKEFKRHQELSRKGAAKRFKGGLVDDSKATVKYHTATHLLHAALRQVLGEHVEQCGSNITPERLRFDFSHGQKLTLVELRKVEQIVNQKIQEKLPVEFEEMTPARAKKKGAVGLFEHKYGKKVKVYKIGKFSQEICGGPHVKNTSELGVFRIVKEESSGAGVRRIKAKLI